MYTLIRQACSCKSISDCVLARLELTYIEKPKTARIAKVHDGRRLCTLYIEGNDNSASLTVTLLKGRMERAEGYEENDEPHRFLRCDIDEYLKESGDTNIIHTGENAVVPGFLMMKAYLDEYPARHIRMKFLNPLFCGQGFSMSKSGISSNRKIVLISEELT